jgi:hypothetical protein
LVGNNYNGNRHLLGKEQARLPIIQDGLEVKEPSPR